MARSTELASAAEAKSARGATAFPQCRRAAGAACDLVGAVWRHADVEHAGAAGDDLSSSSSV